VFTDAMKQGELYSGRRQPVDQHEMFVLYGLAAVAVPV
jgi:hypothetical protein